MKLSFSNFLKPLSLVIVLQSMGLFIVTAPSQAQDSELSQDQETIPESGEEAKLHRLYKKYNEKPTNPETWSQLVEQKKTYNYKVLKGDTLWEISKTLFGDGFFWSKVWSLNPNITNPHQISVGKVIVFTPGSGLDAPGLNVVNQSDIVQGYEFFTGQLPPSAKNPITDLTGINIPQPLKKRMPLLKKFPSSLPHWKYNTNKRSRASKLDFSKIGRSDITSQVDLNFYISEHEIPELGEIVEMEKLGKTASVGDTIFVEAFDSKLRPGEIFTVIKKMGTLKDPEYDFEPTMIEVQGLIKVESQKGDYIKAKVIKSYSTVEVGSQLVRSQFKSYNLNNEGPIINRASTVIGGDFDLRRKLLGIQSLIFLNRGTKDGLTVGKRLYLNANHKGRNPLSLIDGHYWRNGLIKIVHAEQNYSTAVVLENYDAIRPGDFTGSAPSDDATDFASEVDNSSSLKEASKADGSSGDETSKDEDEDQDFDSSDNPLKRKSRRSKDYDDESSSDEDSEDY